MHVQPAASVQAVAPGPGGCCSGWRRCLPLPATACRRGSTAALNAGAVGSSSLHPCWQLTNYVHLCPINRYAWRTACAMATALALT